MTTRIVADDITDELVKPVVVAKADYLTDADNYLLSILQGFNSSLTLESIPTPTPYFVKQLAIAHVCFKVCQDKFGGQVGIAFKGQDGNDRWYTKLKHYEQIMYQYEATMTEELMTGASTTGNGYYSLPIERG